MRIANVSIEGDLDDFGGRAGRCHKRGGGYLFPHFTRGCQETVSRTHTATWGLRNEILNHPSNTFPTTIV